MSQLDFFLSLDFRQKKVSSVRTFLFGFQTQSKIRTVCNRDETELSEIQTSQDFRHSLYSQRLNTERLNTELRRIQNYAEYGTKFHFQTSEIGTRI